MSHTNNFIQDLDIIHDILVDTTSRINIPDEHRMIRAKVKDLGELVASSQERPVFQLTQRQVRLLWELVTMIDVDTLNNNLYLIHEEATDDEELKALANLLDPKGELDKVWAKHPLQP